MKFLRFSILVICFVGSLYAQEEVDNCFCDVASADRVACPAGSNLSQEDCLYNHCCYDVNSTSCYERKASCVSDQCQVNPTERNACGFWQLGKDHCERMNCCYDHRFFPYCFYGKESYGQNETKPEEELPEPDDDVIIDVELNPVGPNATHYNPETSLFITVQCSTDEDRVPCGSASISKEKCLDRSCCWASSSGGPNCFQPSTKPMDDDNDYKSDVGQLFAEYLTIGEEDVLEPQSDNFQEFDYGAFSVIIECLNMDVAGISQELCPATNRARCLDSSCCWNGTDCLRPVSRFSSNTSDVDIPHVQGPHGSTTDPDFWNPVFVNVNVHESVENKKLSCDSAVAALSCGYAGINRTACQEKGCCWMPEYAKKGRYDMLCSLPVLVDGVPMEIVEAKEEKHSDWGPWETWSACYVTEPCSERAERMRWRTCESNEFGSGCRLQEEQVQIVPCFKPTECTDTHWSEWSSWSECSLSCGGFGTQQRQRECIKGKTLDNNPLCEDVHAAFDSLIADKQLKECVRGQCPK